MAEPDNHPEASTAETPPAAPPGGTADRRFADPAGEHLASALRTSFRLLAAIMVVGVLAFLAMGFEFVQPGEMAIRTVFGEVVGTTTAGLAYNWPQPIGRIEKIYVGERTIALDDFWMNETQKDQLQPDLRKRQAPRGGLRPGWDGAMLTGDRNLLHMRLKCTYVVGRGGYELPYDDPLVADNLVVRFVGRSPGPDETVAAAGRRWRREVSDAVPAELRGAEANATLLSVVREKRFPCAQVPALLFRMHVQDPNETMRSVLCGAAIRAAAIRTADSLQRTDRAAFEADVSRIAQEALDELRSGILVRTVRVVRSTWPLRTLPDYDDAQRAVNEAERLKNDARRVAVSLLHTTAGPVAVKKLVGEPADVVDPLGRSLSTRPGGKDTVQENLIGQYNDAARRGEKARAEQILERIEDVLVSAETQGAVRAGLGRARSYYADTVQAVQARVADFRKLLPDYRKNPQFALERWWVETREEILDYPTAEKHYVTPGEKKIVLRINRDPAIVRQVEQELLRKDRQPQAPDAVRAPAGKRK